LLANRWRIYRRAIHSNPLAVEDYVKATCVLHNFLDDCEMDLFENELESGETGLRNIASMGSNHSAASAHEIRQAFTDYFTSQAGYVHWQSNVINRGSN
jgi:hypothetical protein